MADQITEVVGLHTVTASESVGAGSVGIPRGDKFLTLNCRIQVWLASQASGSGTFTWTIQASYDKGNSWISVATSPTLTLTAVAQNTEFLIPFDATVASDSGIDLISVIATLGGSATTPSCAYRCDLIGSTQ